MSMYMVQTTSLNRYMSTDLLSMIGSGARVGTPGRVHGTGDIIRVGGMCITAGRMIGIGITAMHSIITIITARSITDIIHTMVITRCTGMFPEEIMRQHTQIIRSAFVTKG